MSNSPLVSFTRLSPNRNSPRKNRILVITPHHMAGNLTLAQFGNIVANPARQMSSNYAIDSQGNIGLFVNEGDRSWCSSSPTNDHKAITIEVANDGGAPNWHISEKAMNALMELSVDICRRNNISKVIFTGNAAGNITEHNYFTATACPGPFLKSRLQWLTDEVNDRLNRKDPMEDDMTYLLELRGTRNNQIFAEPNPQSKVIAQNADVKPGLYVVVRPVVIGVQVQDTKWCQIMYGSQLAYAVYGGVVSNGARILEPSVIAREYGSPLPIIV